MTGGLYRALAWLARRIGLWVVAAFAWIVSTGYFLLLPRRLTRCVRFYRALFPDRGLVSALGLAWRQYHGFAALFAERLRLQYDPDRLRCTMEGLEHLEQAAETGRGAILLMTHLGNWEIAARILGQRNFKLLLYMGEKQREQIERDQKTDLQRDGVRVVGLREGEDATVHGLEGLHFLKSGGLVSMAGDRNWSDDQPSLEVGMLGSKVSLPKAPHALALITGSPVITFFVVRTGRLKFHFRAFAPRPVTASARSERAAALQQSAEHYVDQLVEMLRQHPTQWYHFEPFLKPPQ
ncbi:MAG: lysophospholipid acyltransferase family protein [bacterium]